MARQKLNEPTALQNFAALLAAETDPVKRAGLLKRAEMLALNQADISAFEPPVQSLGDYLDTPIEIPPSLVWPTLVVRGEVTATLGRAGRGKTTINLNRILKWASGKALFENFRDRDNNIYLAPPEPLRILIIENEGAAGMFHNKMGMLLARNDQLTDEEVSLMRENVLVWGDGGYSGLKLDDTNALNQVRAGVEKHKPDILFIEPFRSLWRGEENSSTDMAVVVDNLIGLGTDYGCGVLLAHHERKSGSEIGEGMDLARGSTVLEGAVAVMENFSSAKGGDFRELSWSKSRYLQPPPTMRLQYDVETAWYTFIAEDMVAAAVLFALKENDGEAMNITTMAEILDEKPPKLRKVCKELKEAGKIKMESSISGPNGSTGPRYRLPSDDSDFGGLAL